VRLLAISLALSIGAVACVSTSQESEPALLPSELHANADLYDGQRVVVQGYAVIHPEARSLYDSAADAGVHHDRCVGLDGPPQFFSAPFRERDRRRLSGVFHKDACSEEQMCPYWCSDSIIVLDRNSRP
jgi:hypothetical protein